MGRHSAPTALTRAAKRAGVATSAFAAAASLTVAGAGTAQAADTIPGASQAEGAYGKLLKQATEAAAKAVNQGAKATTQVIGAYNKIPVLADVIKVTTADGVTIPVIGNLRLATAADDYETDAMATYKGIAGEYEGGGTWSWGDNGGTGGAPYLYVNTLTDPLGIVKGGTAFLGVPVLNVGNGGFNVGDNFSQTWVRSNGGILSGDAGFHLPFFSLDNDGLALAGPKLYAGPTLAKYGSADFGINTGSIVIGKNGEITLTGPALTDEKWNDVASIAAPGYGKLTGGFTTGSLVLDGANSKFTAPKASVGAETFDLGSVVGVPIGKVNVGTGIDGGTIEKTGINGVSGKITAGNTTTSTKTVENKDDANDETKVTSTTDTTVTTNNQLTLGGKASSSSTPVVTGDSTTTTNTVVTTTGTEKDAKPKLDSDTTTTTTTSISTDGGLRGPDTTTHDNLTGTDK